MVMGPASPRHDVSERGKGTATSFVTDIEQVKNEKKSFTFRWMRRQITLKDSGKGQQWHRSMWNAWII
jgi:hypothetical protein